MKGDIYTFGIVLILIVIAYVLISGSREGFNCANLGYDQWFNQNSVYFQTPFLFNIPTRNFPIYPDIRGEPNSVYYPGSETPCGYKYSPYIYDTQGNHFKFLNDDEYIA